MRHKDVAPFELKFHLKVESGDADKCWVWKGKLGKHGYGRFVFGKPAIKEYPHRVAYVLHHKQSLFQAEIVTQTCGNRACCNPDHLQLNPKTGLRGESHPRAKLKTTDVLEIRKVLGKLPRKEIAARFNVKVRLISDIASGRSWRHI